MESAEVEYQASLGLIRSVVQERPTEESPTLLEDTCCKVAVLVSAICRSAECCLKSEAIYQVEFAPHHYASCAFTHFLHDEVASIKAEIL